MNMKKLLFVPLFQLLILNVIAQNYWTNIEGTAIGDAQIKASNSTYLHLDYLAFKNELFQAPLKTNKLQWSDIQVEIPLPDGSFEEFLAFETPMMEDGLAAKYPNIKTFTLVSKSNQTTYGRADITPKGFHAMIFSDNGTLFIDPISATSNENYIVYYKKDFISTKELPSCLTENADNIEDNVLELDHDEVLNFKSTTATKASNGLILKTYKIAVSATAEYTNYHGGTVADGLAAIVTTFNRVNGIYENEIAVSLILVDDNDLIIYTDASTDPFDDTDNASQILTENRTSLNTVIGEDNYDIGHVVGTDGSGLAGFGVVCSENRYSHKAYGTTGISNPIGDPFDVDYVSHEVGHQFGASHTFNGTTGSCSGNRAEYSAYEPGSATTIMGYAGICTGQNVQNNSDDYFHNRSLIQITEFINDDGATCAVEVSTGNDIPTVEIVTPTNLSIPISTPFELEALAADVNGDALTYCWEQYDLGDAGAPNSPSGNAPLFRSFSPTTDPVRVFPQISDILSGSSTLGEILPSYARDMSFKVTVRDNVPNAAAFIDETISVNVEGSAGPFLVTSQSSNITWEGLETYEVTWDVANTDQSPVNCSEVSIYLSLDGGATFPYVLASNTANSGSAYVQAPNALTSEARIKVVCDDNIFFNVNTSDFEIFTDCAYVDGTISVDEEVNDAIWCLDATGELDFEVSSPYLLITSYQWYHNNVAIAGATDRKLVIDNVENTDAGDYYCEISNGCTSIFTNTASVSVTTNTIIPTISVENGVLISSLSYGNQWYLDDVALLGATEQTFIPAEEGTYSVKSVVGACSASSSSYTTAIKDLNEVVDIQIMPNPTNGIITISAASYEETLNVEVRDILGKKLYQTQFNQLTQIDLSGYANGMYFINLQSENYSASYKIMKK